MAVATLHEDVYNVDKYVKVNQLKHSLDEIETMKTKSATIRAKVIWQQVGDKCTADFF